jgi:hypothetical protein
VVRKVAIGASVGGGRSSGVRPSASPSTAARDQGAPRDEQHDAHGDSEFALSVIPPKAICRPIRRDPSARAVAPRRSRRGLESPKGPAPSPPGGPGP